MSHNEEGTFTTFDNLLTLDEVVNNLGSRNYVCSDGPLQTDPTFEQLRYMARNQRVLMSRPQKPLSNWQSMAFSIMYLVFGLSLLTFIGIGFYLLWMYVS